MPAYLKKAKETPAIAAATIDVAGIVKGVINSIRENGDAAVLQYSNQFDSWSRDSFKLSPEEIQEAIAQVPEQTIKDIKEVQQNVRTFAEAQRQSLKDFELEIQPGVFLGQKNLPINRVGA